MIDSATWSLAEAAAYLGVSEDTCWRQARERGEILPGVPALKIRSAYRVPRAKLVAAVEGVEVAS